MIWKNVRFTNTKKSSFYFYHLANLPSFGYYFTSYIHPLCSAHLCPQLNNYMVMSSANGRPYLYRCVLPGFIDGLVTVSITDKNKVDHFTMISALHPVFLFLVYNCSKTRNAQTDDIKRYVINKNIRCKSLLYWWRHLFTCMRLILSLSLFSAFKCDYWTLHIVSVNEMGKKF